MAKRPTTRRRAATTYREVNYDPAVFDELFRLADAAWTRPRRLRVSVQARGWTLDAKFIGPSGHTYALRTRVKRYADGSYAINEESLSIRFHLRSEGARK